MEPHNKFLKIKQKKRVVTYRFMLLSKLEVLYLMTRMYLVPLLLLWTVAKLAKSVF